VRAAFGQVEFGPMKSLTSIVLAGAVAMSAVAASTTGASAGGWHGHHGQYHPPMYQGYYYGPDAGAVAAGAILGLAFGALAAEAFVPAPYYAYPPAPPPVYPTYAYGDPNTAWCAAQYSSYNPETNTWADFQGVIHVCFGPY
jgi:hypothetical protein